MAFGKFVRFTLLLVLSLVLTIHGSAVAQEGPHSEPVATQNAGEALQNDASRLAGTSAAVDSRGKESPAPPESGMPVAQDSIPAQTTISGGDLLNIAVYGVSELALDVRVNNTGDVYLPLIGYVQLAGLTLDQSQTVIENRLREGGFVNNPHVTVFLKDFVNQSATVTGEVNRPGAYPIVGSRRLLEVLASAGGPTLRAGKTVTITHRDHPDEPTKIDLPTALAQSSKENVEVLPGDTVVVNRAGIVYVVGEVQRPAGLVMDNNEHMTVMQAIALVGGPTSVAAMNGTRLIRTTATGGRQEMPLPLKKMLAAKQADFDLKPDDIIFVPGSVGKKAAKRSLDSVLAVTQGIAIYHP